MKKIDSDALGSLNKALGLSGAGSSMTELADGVVDQALDVVPAIRRGRTQAATEGWYVSRMVNVHAVANSLTSVVNLFAPGGQAIPPFPAPMPDRFDLWLLAASVVQTAGAGTISAALFLNTPAIVVGLSTTGTASIISHCLAHWDTIVDENVLFAQLQQGGTMQRIGLRIPRSITTQLVFATTSSEAATFQLATILGVFPIALGQDVLV